MPVRFRPFEPADQPAFRALNEAWIVKYFAMESKDYEALDYPEATILNQGGHIFIGVDSIGMDGEEPIACCALLPREPGCYEIGKMAVSESRRGQGLGRQLLDHTISQAKALGATRLYLESNARLTSAVHLYESAGFRHLPPERVVPSAYARSGLYMEMFLWPSILAEGSRLFAESLEGIAPAEETQKPQPDRWSVLECAEHVAVVEEHLISLILLAEPSETATIDPRREGWIRTRAADRSHFIPAPDGVLPAGRFTGVASAHSAFRAARRRALAYLEAETRDLRRLFTTHPMIPGPVHISEMFAMLASHPIRHAAQIREIRSLILSETGRAPQSRNGTA